MLRTIRLDFVENLPDGFWSRPRVSCEVIDYIRYLLVILINCVFCSMLWFAPGRWYIISLWIFWLVFRFNIVLNINLYFFFPPIRLSNNRPSGWIVQQEVARMMDSLLDPFSSFASFSKPVRRTNQSSKRSHLYRSSSQQTQTQNVASNTNRANNGNKWNNFNLNFYCWLLKVELISFLDNRPNGNHQQQQHKPNGPSEKWAASLRKRDPELLPAIRHTRRDR